MVNYMYNDTLSAEIKKKNLEKPNITKSNPKLKFREILCPKSCQAISTEECKTCPSRQELHRKHELGLSLVTIICMWNVTESSPD